PEVPSSIRPGVKNDGNFDVSADVHFARYNGKPVSGPHNSYLTVLARMGLLGAAAFAAFLAALGAAIWRRARAGRIGLAELLAITLCFDGLFYALFNTGFESGYNCYLLWLAAGMCLERAR
ncbi:MAG: hypothetical protein HY075_08065, partial [Deltaproteobacteria bacterium]|nr:hypothetical protein [Deltaproteobacteria bacterium]